MTVKQKQWREYYAKNKDRLNEQRRKKLKALYAKNSDFYKSQSQKYRDALKYETLKRYSKTEEPSCTQCGFSEIGALCIDHVENNGNEERMRAMKRNVGGSGSRFYAFLKRKKYPNGYQTLCANCNLIKEIKRRQNAKC